MSQEKLPHTLTDSSLGQVFSSQRQALSPSKSGALQGRNTGKSRAGEYSLAGKPQPTTGSRFVPDLTQEQFATGQHLLTNKPIADELSPSRRDHSRLLAESYVGIDLENVNILHYTKAAPNPAEGWNGGKVLHATQLRQPTSRHIPSSCLKSLDAPGYRDDYYMQLLDYSPTEQKAVICLDTEVYLMDSVKGGINVLLDRSETFYHCTSVSVSPDGYTLACGFSDNKIYLVDLATATVLRKFEGHSGRVAAMCWNRQLLVTGSSSGSIMFSDISIRDHHVSTLAGHTQEITSLNYSCGKKYLASGGNDNLVQIWQSPGPAVGPPSAQPLQTLSDFKGAVKLAWCPWRESQLATGAGSEDRRLMLWSATTGAELRSVDTQSQVTGVLYNEYYNEVMTSHGYTPLGRTASEQLNMWSMKKFGGPDQQSMRLVHSVKAHKDRVCQMVQSPIDGLIATGGADETVKIWDLWRKDASSKKNTSNQGPIHI